MPKLDLDSIPLTNATGYPSPWREQMAKRWYRRLAPAAGLEDFGASHVRLEPGGLSAQRHWHEGEDELLVMIAGEAVLIDDNGRANLGPGDVCAFPKNDGNGHYVANESDADCLFVVIGNPSVTDCHYPDIDMHLPAGAKGFTRKDGTPF
jgi:uncharacterized cupin superfamily protein